MKDFATISDEELAVRCKRNWLEEWLHGSGCVIGLVFGFVAAATVITLSFFGVMSWGWYFSTCLAFVAFFAIPFLTYGFLNWLARFRCRHLLRELEHRYGCRPLAEYVKETCQFICPGEIVFILTGSTLPRGQHWWVSVRITGEQSGTVEARFGPVLYDDRFSDFGSGHNPKDRFKIAKGNLAPEVARRLSALAGSIQKTKTDLPSTVIDGFPIACAVVFGGTKQTKFVSCNLAGIPDSPNEESYVLLVKEAFFAGRVLIDSPSGFGSCSSTGEIQIGNV